MAVENITFLLFIGIGILSFTFMAFHYQGIVWLAWIAAIFWLLLGIWCRTCLDICFAFQRELGVLFMGCFVAMLLAPFYMRAKHADIENDAPNDIDIWAERRQAHRDMINKHKNLRR